MNKKTIAIILITLMIPAAILTACSGARSTGDGDASKIPDAFEGREASELGDYEGMDEYQGDIMLVDTTVAEMDEMMSNDETFVVFFSYADCPYCNRLIPYLNEVAAESGVHVGYINTRSNPEWMSNVDIDDYDIVVSRFRKWLEKDESGEYHLYTPDMYFIKNGKVAARHEGVTPGADDPSQPLTSSQEDRLRTDLRTEFATLN